MSQISRISTAVRISGTETAVFSRLNVAPNSRVSDCTGIPPIREIARNCASFGAFPVKGAL